MARWLEQKFSNPADYTAKATFTAEASLLAGVKIQPYIRAHAFDSNDGYGKRYRLEASGVLGTTGTPTYIFQVRLGPTVGPASLAGASVGVSAAITTQSGVTNKPWSLRLDINVVTPGQDTGQATLSCFGWVKSPGGFAAPYEYPLEVTTPDTATWTQTRDASVDNYFNLSVTSSASDALNTLTCKMLELWGS